MREFSLEINASNAKIVPIFYLLTQLQEEELLLFINGSPILLICQKFYVITNNIAIWFTYILTDSSILLYANEPDTLLILLGSNIHFSNDLANFHGISGYHPSFDYFQFFFNLFIIVFFFFLRFQILL